MKKIYLENESLVLKGLCTSTFKVVRSLSKKYYNEIIEELYKEWLIIILNYIMIILLNEIFSKIILL